MACFGDSDGVGEEYTTGQCKECGGDIDDDGDSTEPDNCSYSPEDCSKCHHSPCDQSC